MVRLAYNIVHIPKIGDTKRFVKRAEDLFAAAGIENLEVPSVYMPTMNEVLAFHQDNQNFRYKAHEVFGTPFPGNCGVVGAFASHYSIWKKMAETRHDAVIVIEDNAFLTDDFLHTINCLLLCAPANYDFISLYTPPAQNVLFNPHKHQHVSPGLCKAYQSACSSAYIVSQKGALTALYDVGLFGFALPIDIYIWGRGPGRFANFAPLPETPAIVQVMNEGGGHAAAQGEPLTGPVEQLIEVETVTESSDEVMH